jgi:ankyrin repeat protein
VIDALVKANADISLRAKNGDTALDFAVKYGEPEVITLLRNAASP